MSELADLFPGFESHWIDTPEGKVFARAGGKGDPLILLHGFPQTHVMWHKIAPELAKHFRVILLDLRGYGWSSAPRTDAAHTAYSKRAMGDDVIRVAEHFGFAQFRLVGHDRGARVAYRLALDHPGRVKKLGLLDIIPTIAMWERMDAKRAMQVYHWSFLAQLSPMPETMIGKAPVEWLEHTLASWTLTKDLKSFDRRALAHYRAFFIDPARIHAVCEDYRAGAGLDCDHDSESLAKGEVIACPVLILWGEKGIPAENSTPLDDWRAFAPHASGEAILAGHFLPEENPQATAEALIDFMT